ncbi:hypothetical protein [Fictibacillus gelatini]|uniref:hypothetical protein n=1 Tax=Fictibacillus gelatini TaxID=225985 RepID=UPI000402C103|nr:hypothetical protein [Fictibacillus gelatini]
MSFGIGASAGSFFGLILFGLDGWAGFPWLVVSLMGASGSILTAHLKRKERCRQYYSAANHS